VRELGEDLGPRLSPGRRFRPAWPDCATPSPTGPLLPPGVASISGRGGFDKGN
jgi:hypothetical protein